jgi:hypothetical protein
MVDRLLGHGEFSQETNSPKGDEAMRFGIGKGRILKIRPGHLANFSGGAGYMPFVVIYSVPASILFGFLGSLLLTARGRKLLGAGGDTKTGLHEFVRFARWHSMVCLTATVVAGTFLFVCGNALVYGDKVMYAPITAIFAMGPFAAWLVSMVVLARLIVRRGPKKTNIVISSIVHALLLAACIPLSMLVSAITGSAL